jgi:hypothetical protein
MMYDTDWTVAFFSADFASSFFSSLSMLEPKASI